MDRPQGSEVNSMDRRRKVMLLFVAVFMLSLLSRASTTYNVALNTAPLVGHPSGPFILLAELSAGGWTGKALNTVRLSDISLGGGSFLGDPVMSGGASGDLGTEIKISDSSPFSLFTQQFAPGNQLSFTVHFNSKEGMNGTPDKFAVVILDSAGVPIPTLSPFGSYFFGVDMFSSAPKIAVYGSDPSRPLTSGAPVTIQVPTVRGRSATRIATLNSASSTIDVVGFGFSPPVGSLSFVDASSGNPVAPQVVLDPASAKTSFLPQIITRTGEWTHPAWATLTDLDGDGNLDLLTSLNLNDSVSVQLGNRDGTFRPASRIRIASGFGPGENHVADLRGNGTQDLIVASATSNRIAVLLGNGDGTFQNPMVFESGAPRRGPVSFATGDFNLDGHVDVAITNGPANSIDILYGDGSGKLAASGSPIYVGRMPQSILAADLNGDGFSDLLVADAKDGTVRLLLNNRDDTFRATSISLGRDEGDGPEALALAPQGSGWLMAVVGRNRHGISLFHGSADGAFGPPENIPLKSGVRSLTFGDFNGDQIPDLVAVNAEEDTVSVVLLGAASGYSIVGPFKVGRGPVNVALGDLDQDGTPDLVIVNCVSDTTGVLLGGTEISVSLTGLSLTPGESLEATYLPNPASSYGPSNSPAVSVLSSGEQSARAGAKQTPLSTVPVQTLQSGGTVSTEDRDNLEKQNRNRTCIGTNR
jgi:hypothetical protein